MQQASEIKNSPIKTNTTALRLVSTKDMSREDWLDRVLVPVMPLPRKASREFVMQSVLFEDVKWRSHKIDRLM